MKKLLWLGVLILMSNSVFGKQKSPSGVSQKPGLLAAAVANSDIDQVRKLLSRGVSPDDVDERGQQALIIAASSDQFHMANLLVEKGADIWVSNKLGFTPALFAHTSHLKKESDEGKARDEFIARLKKAGYPWPPPWQDEILKMREAGKWPPTSRKKK